MEGFWRVLENAVPPFFGFLVGLGGGYFGKCRDDLNGWLGSHDGPFASHADVFFFFFFFFFFFVATKVFSVVIFLIRFVTLFFSGRGALLPINEI